MTRSKAVGSAQGLRGKSKHWENYKRHPRGSVQIHWANYKRHPRGSVQIQCADKAEALFFFWLWRKKG